MLELLFLSKANQLLTIKYSSSHLLVEKAFRKQLSRLNIPNLHNTSLMGSHQQILIQLFCRLSIAIVASSQNEQFITIQHINASVIQTQDGLLE
jgi:hypothetical protein